MILFFPRPLNDSSSIFVPLHFFASSYLPSFLHLVHALIQGPAETPYEFGLFFFSFSFPQDYPWSSPKAEIKTTSKGTVRFNPNLYSNGKVCLSILGTWAGPGWTPSLSLETVLVSIQSLLGESPMQNEPGVIFLLSFPISFKECLFLKSLAYTSLVVCTLSKHLHPSPLLIPTLSM